MAVGVDQPGISVDSPFFTADGAAIGCGSTSTQTYPANPMTLCCMAFHCFAGDGSWYFPAHMDFTVVTAGSCPEAQDSGVFSSTATRCDALDPMDPDYCAGGAFRCADIATDPLHCTIWTTYLCGTEYLWRPDLTGYTIPDCGPFVGGAQLLCSLAPVGFPGISNCTHLDTKHPRAGWLQSSFQLYRTKYLPITKECFCTFNDDGSQTCTWYYMDGDCVLQVGGTYTIPAGGGGPGPPCPAGTTASGCVCCRPECAACVDQCTAISSRCVSLVDCCDSPPGNSSICSTDFPISVPGGCTQGVAGDFFWNKPGCYGDCGHCLPGRDYRLAFCTGCSSQDDLQGCNPYNCPPDPKNYGGFVVRIAACPQFNMDGSYLSCTPMSSGDYIDWHCPATVGESAAHRAFVLVSNGVPHEDALAVTGATEARAFRPCRHHPHDPTCIFCHSVAYTPGYAESIDRRLAGEKTVGVGVFDPTKIPAVRQKRGIGTVMAEAFAELGFEQQGGCGCGSLESQLNNATPEGVEQHLAKFAEQLRENAVKLGYAEKIAEAEKQAREMLGNPTLNIYEMVITGAVEVYRGEIASKTSGSSGADSSGRSGQ